jgi:RimJ/RimL family protein N-acetyltransferase
MNACGTATNIPTLETARLRLLPPGVECDAAYASFYTNAEASRAYGGPLSAGAAWARLSADLGSWHLQGFGVWALQRKLEGDIIGTCGFWRGKGWPRELTWWLLPAARRQGFAREASIAAVRHAYESFGWNEVTTYMNDENEPARALVLNLGGIRTGRAGFPDGLQRDVYLIPRPAADQRPRSTP